MTQIDITKERKGSFLMALADAEPGAEIVYHIGDHASGHHKADAQIAGEGGYCLLYQRRLGDRRFAYIARKPKG